MSARRSTHNNPKSVKNPAAGPLTETGQGLAHPEKKTKKPALRSKKPSTKTAKEAIDISTPGTFPVDDVTKQGTTSPPMKTKKTTPSAEGSPGTLAVPPLAPMANRAGQESKDAITDIAHGPVIVKLIVPSKPYHTRNINDPHPALSAGVKTTKALIAVEAEQKRAEKLVIAEEKAAGLEHELKADQEAIARDEADEMARDEVDEMEVDHEETIDGDLTVESASTTLKIKVRGGAKAAKDADVTADDGKVLEPKPGKKGKKGKKMKKDERQEIRSAVDKKCKALKTPASVNKKAKATDTSATKSALLPNWQQSIRALQASKAKPGKGTSKKSKKTSTRKVDPSETIGSFTDADVDTTLAEVIQPCKQMVEIVVDSENSSKISQSKHRTTNEIPKEESLSRSVLASWVIIRWTSHFVPTLLQNVSKIYIPWDISDMILEIILKSFKQVFPTCNCKIDKMTKVFRIARQAIYTWRSNFLKWALVAVRQELTAKAKTKLLTTEDDLAAYVNAALDCNGEAFWGLVDPIPKDALQSTFVLKTFAPHLSATTASIVDGDYPRGALALALTAVEWVFKMWTMGKFIASPSPFAEEHVRSITEDWASGSVTKLYLKPERFDLFLAKALKYVERRPAAAPEEVRALIFDPSSPPAVAEDAEMDDGDEDGHKDELDDGGEDTDGTDNDDEQDEDNNNDKQDKDNNNNEQEADDDDDEQDEDREEEDDDEDEN
ncbi:hypothetical protein JAAARDRAFT_46434 [Jaapia argillacea MUCL 33604]|uniref:Uncharacterized protein n=1 Tax=Jaapia argillacea MUCL 33604 TaxID=933084 RepID=A0A067Q111_9AGAM|nr:hypothetical protein JAAARDRAFT_46434 [Jaapia argillacea MUCL 33604]